MGATTGAMAPRSARPIAAATQYVAMVAAIAALAVATPGREFRRPAGRYADAAGETRGQRSEEHTYELQSLMRTSYGVFGSKKKKQRARQKRCQKLLAKTSCNKDTDIHYNETTLKSA